MLRCGDAEVKMQDISMGPHEVPARLMMWKCSSTEEIGPMLAGMRRRASALNCLRYILRRIAPTEGFEFGG